MSFSPHIRAMIRYIEAHIRDEKVNYKEMEERVGFSEAYIRELFRRSTGCSLSRYVRNRKIQVSAFDLLHSDAAIMDIALQYGYTNHESYTRAFRKIVGMTPSCFRKERPVVSKEELAPGIYGIGFPGKKERRSDISMDKEKYMDNDSTVLYGMPKVGWGSYGGNTPYPICLKACLDYLGEDVSYDYVMVSGGAAFRLTWNEEMWDLSNIDIYHTMDESSKIYYLGAEALGREFEFLGRDKNTTKEEFIQFIKKNIDRGYPCIAQGIIGPPEACVITGYRKQGETLLGWNFFQDDSEFAGSVKKDESGYFICDNWWENKDTQGVMCMGAIQRETFSRKEILENAVKVMTGRKEYAYAKGVAAYDAWERMLGNDSDFRPGNNDSVLLEKILCQNDAMSSLIDGRNCAANYFSDLAKMAAANNEERRISYTVLAGTFERTKDIVCQMRELFGNWEDMDARLSDTSGTSLRKKACEYIRQAKKSDEESLRLMEEMLEKGA